MLTIFKEIIQSLILISLIHFPLSVNASSKNIITYSEESNSVHFIADINQETVSRLIRIHDETNFDTIVITSPGGEFDSGIDMAAFVINNNIKFIVNHYCNSSCTIPFFSAPINNRHVLKGSTLGLHNITVQIDSSTPEDTYITVKQMSVFTEELSEKVGILFVLYANNNIPADTLIKVAQTRGNDIIKLKREELLRLGIIRNNR